MLRIALRHPAVLPDSATVGDVRGFLAKDHVHLALLVDAEGVLRTCIDRGDLAAAAAVEDGASAVGIGSTDGRTVLDTDDAVSVAKEMARTGVRRLAAVDDGGRLVGLVCRKRSGQGFCSDEGVAARQAERRVSDLGEQGVDASDHAP